MSGELTADIGLASRGRGEIDISDRADADVALVAGNELPFADRALRSAALGDGIASMSFRDRLLLFAECRRALVPGGTLLLVEPRADETLALLSVSAAMVGLSRLPHGSGASGWCKPVRDATPEPLVSILIPAYNPRYFAHCLDSAIAQTWRNVEIVVCDDSEGDAIAAMVEARSPPAAVRYEKNPSRLGARGNYARCLALARGEYVKFLNDDDVLAPECVQTLVSAFLRVPDLVLATSHRRIIDAQSRVQQDNGVTSAVVDRDMVIDGLSLANAAIMYGLNFIGEPTTALFRRDDLLDRERPDDDPFAFSGEKPRGNIDLVMWTRLLMQGHAAFFSARLSDFRRHGEQAQAQPDFRPRSVAGLRLIQREWVRLGLFRLYPPHLLCCKPLSPPDEPEGEWRLVPRRSLPSTGVPPDEELRRWRAVERHPFDLP